MRSTPISGDARPRSAARARERAQELLEEGKRAGQALVAASTGPDGVVDGLALLCRVGLVLEVLERQSQRDRQMWRWPLDDRDVKPGKERP